MHQVLLLSVHVYPSMHPWIISKSVEK